MDARQAAVDVAADGTGFLRRSRLKEASLTPNAEETLQKAAHSNAQRLPPTPPPTTPGEDHQEDGSGNSQPAQKKRKVATRKRTRPILIEPIHSPLLPAAPTHPGRTHAHNTPATPKSEQNASDLLRNMLQKHIAESQLHLSEAYEEVRFDLAVRSIRSRELKEARAVLDERINEVQQRISTRQSFYGSTGLCLPQTNTASGSGTAAPASASTGPAPRIKCKITNDRIAQVSFDREKAGAGKSDSPSIGFDLAARCRALSSIHSRQKQSNGGDRVILLEVLHRYLYPVNLSRGFMIKKPPKGRIQKPQMQKKSTTTRRRKKKGEAGSKDGDQSLPQGTTPLAQTSVYTEQQLLQQAQTPGSPSVLDTRERSDPTASVSERWPDFFESLDTIFAAAAAEPSYAAATATDLKSLEFDLDVSEAPIGSSSVSQADIGMDYSLNSQAPTVTDSVFGDDDKMDDAAATPQASLFDLAQAFGLGHQHEDSDLKSTQSEDQRTVIDVDDGNSTQDQPSPRQAPTNLQTDLDFDDLMAQLI